MKAFLAFAYLGLITGVSVACLSFELWAKSIYLAQEIWSLIQ